MLHEGFFDYEHAARFKKPHRLEERRLLIYQGGPRVSGPYFRQSAPARPLHVDQLPPLLRAAVAAVRFDLSFAEEQAIQPAEHLSCASEQAEYVTLAGERRSFRGSVTIQASSDLAARFAGSDSQHIRACWTW
jgi:hypothetical protein